MDRKEEQIVPIVQSLFICLGHVCCDPVMISNAVLHTFTWIKKQLIRQYKCPARLVMLLKGALALVTYNGRW